MFKLKSYKPLQNKLAPLLFEPILQQQYDPSKNQKNIKSHNKYIANRSIIMLEQIILGSTKVDLGKKMPKNIMVEVTGIEPVSKTA
tara:strand:+ start:1870 stop:2127 length:258 start_codon:yes stop_codon:yes gene_type:complete